MNSSALEFRIVDKTIEQSLAEFFSDLKRMGDNQYFRPHPLTDEEAEKIAHYSGKDLYYILIESENILGYGMLRGWDEGYEVPSLGIVIRPSARGMGLGKLFMQFLYAAARRRGASKVRLKVYPDNTIAVTMYQELGYTFQAGEEGQLVGFIDL